MSSNRIDAWTEPPTTLFPPPKSERAKGTQLHYEGDVLRCRGDGYRAMMGKALVAARSHGIAEGHIELQ